MANLRASYCIDDFLQACKEEVIKGSSIIGLEGWVLRSASRDFNIKTKRSLIEFIAYGGLEDLRFINTSPYRISLEVPPPMCDAYTFSSGFTEGYLAFFFSETNQRWIIKSFHRSFDSSETMFSLAFRKAGIETKI